MSNEETILSVLADIRDDVKQVHEKTDQIIQRNAKADVNIAVLQNQFSTHETQDNTRFSKVEKRVDKHSGFWWGTLVFLVVQLLGVVAFLLTH